MPAERVGMLWVLLSLLNGVAAGAEIAPAEERCPLAYPVPYLQRFWLSDSINGQMGNMLSLYWHYRAMAMLSSHKFVLGRRKGPSTSWLAELPHTSCDSSAHPPAALERAQECMGKDAEAPHLCVGTWTAMLDLARNESLGAMLNYEEKHTSKPVHAGTGDVAVHFRCGDVLSIKHHRYGMMKWAWIVQQVPKDAKRILIVGNVRVKRIQDAGNGEACSALLAELAGFLRRKTSKPVLHVSHGINGDFLVLTRAQTVIGSTSTFALWAAMLHTPAPKGDDTQVAAGKSSPPMQTIHLPICDLFFHSEPPKFPSLKRAGISVQWHRTAFVGSSDLYGQSVPDIVRLLTTQTTETDSCME
jgi:hypothetical protein